MQTPVVNWNGTARADLLAQYEAAGRALNDALIAFASAAPHGRDYQTVAGGWSRALELFEIHASALRAARDYCEAMYTAIDQQAGGANHAKV